MATGRVPTTANSPLTAKGDLFGYSTTQARVAVGNDGETLVADSSTSTGLRYQGNFAAGKNKIINGDMNIWQRGTSINIAAASFGFGADRWGAYVGTGAAVTISRQAFTPGAAPVAGYESNYFLRYSRTTTGSAESYLYQRIEDVTTFAGQTVTISFWAKVGSTVTFPIGDIYLEQNFGTGGSTAVTTNVNTSTQAISTSWTRYSFTVAVPSISGKTIGTSSQLGFVFRLPTSFSTVAFDLWGVQVEAGSTATAFQTATGTIQGELAACKRYLPSIDNFSGSDSSTLNGYAYATNGSMFVANFDVQARVQPTGMTIVGTGCNAYALNVATTVTPTFNAGSVNNANLLASHTITAGQGSRLYVTAGTKLLFTGCEL
jgi:hypothetical protein